MVKTPKWPVPLGSKPIDLGLDRVFEALFRLGNPHHRLPPVIHVAGTNGKGSTIAFLKAILEAWGKKVHVYTSPHLVEFNERIILAGEIISDEILNDALEETRQKCEDINLTFFEGTTIAALWAFSKIPADFVLLEVGMGGRLDATNIMGLHGAPPPLMSIITPVSIDHIEFLGETLEKIAYEKASIIKPDNFAIISKQEGAALKVIKRFADEKNARLKIFGRDFDYNINEDMSFIFRNGERDITLPQPSLTGLHQYINASSAIAASVEINVPESAMIKGISSATWPARMQELSPDVYLDGGHNVQAAAVIRDFIWDKNEKEKKKNIAIVGMLRTKDFKNFIIELAKAFDEIIITKIPDEENCREPLEIKQVCDGIDVPARVIESPEKALKYAKSEGARTVICGSLYLAGYVLEHKLK